MEENYLAKWLSGELSEEERKAFESSAEFTLYKRIAEESAHLSAPDFQGDKVWEQLTVDRSAQLQDESDVIAMEPTNRSWVEPFRPFLKIAAAIVVVMGLSYFYINSQETILLYPINLKWF
jgi:hypothetical protein